MKINFGCGGNILEGWRNHDADVDITKPLPYANDVAELILAEHVCEHVSTPDFFRFMLECHRLLKPGGKLRLCLPVLDKLNRDHARDIILNHGHLAAYTVDSLVQICSKAGFTMLENASFDPTIDGHWKVIGRQKDEQETYRILLIK